jgi:hypothetical protein
MLSGWRWGLKNCFIRYMTSSLMTSSLTDIFFKICHGYKTAYQKECNRVCGLWARNGGCKSAFNRFLKNCNTRKTFLSEGMQSCGFLAGGKVAVSVLHPLPHNLQHPQDF